MKNILFAFAAENQNRFPKPDFGSGYEYPVEELALPWENLWLITDIFLLCGLMSFVAWAVLKKRSRTPIVWVSVISVLYFGFFRAGCVCTIGSIQNVALAMADSSYILPFAVVLFFILPLVFAFFFGRVFCAGVCPFGALQELVNIKNFKIPRALSLALSLIPWIYLIFALLYAVTNTLFIICKFDPFVGIFRLGGDVLLISLGVLLLVGSMFTGRLFCRFICPYGVLLSLVSRFSLKKIEITKKECNNCQLCHNSCPVDAIKAPYENKVKETRTEGVKRLLRYFVLLPILVLAGVFLMRSFSADLSKVNKDVQLYQQVLKHEAVPLERLTVNLDAFYGQGGSVELLSQKAQKIEADFKFYSGFAGGLIGLLIALFLIKLSIKRSRKSYEIDHADCVACGRCFSYCPQNELNETK